MCCILIGLWDMYCIVWVVGLTEHEVIWYWYVSLALSNKSIFGSICGSVGMIGWDSMTKYRLFLVRYCLHWLLYVSMSVWRILLRGVRLAPSPGSWVCYCQPLVHMSSEHWAPATCIPATSPSPTYIMWWVSCGALWQPSCSLSSGRLENKTLMLTLSRKIRWQRIQRRTSGKHFSCKTMSWISWQTWWSMATPSYRREPLQKRRRKWRRLQRRGWTSCWRRPTRPTRRATMLTVIRVLLKESRLNICCFLSGNRILGVFVLTP